MIRGIGNMFVSVKCSECQSNGNLRQAWVNGGLGFVFFLCLSVSLSLCLSVSLCVSLSPCVVCCCVLVVVVVVVEEVEEEKGRDLSNHLGQSFPQDC